MTREEAIYCMKSYIDNPNYEHCTSCPYYGANQIGENVFVCNSGEAHKMAVEALEQEPCEDCIAIPVNLVENLCKALSEYEHSDGDCFSEIHDACVDIDAFCRDKLNEPSSSEKIISKNLCDSCINSGCIFQSGIVRNHCDFYKGRSLQELGKWIDRSIPDMAQFMCSRCEGRSFFKTKYCPNCGKKMEVDE